MLERRSGSQIDLLQGLVSGDVILIELVLRVKEHYLTQLIQGLERLWLDSDNIVLELLDEREDELGHWSVLELGLDVSAHIQRLSITLGCGDDLVKNNSFDIVFQF